MGHSTHAARVITASFAVTMSLVLASCSNAAESGGETSAAGDEATGELRILANITPVLTEDYYLGLIQPWLDDNEGVEVTIEAPTGTDVQETLQQQLASGSVPDIVASNLEAVVASEMEPFPDEDWVNDTPLADANRVDGNVWQVATGAQIQSLVFYNKDAFEEAGITELPADLDSFTAARRQLKQAGYLPLQTAGEWVTGAQFAMLANPGLLSNDDWFSQRNEESVSFADSAYNDYMETYATWISEELVAPDALGFKYQDSIDSFTSGEAGTYIMGNWVVPSIDEAATFEAGVFPVPTPDGEAPAQLGGAAQPYSIPKAAENKELARSLVEYLVTDEAAIAASLESEGNFRPGVSYDGSPLNQAVAAILDDAPGLVLGTSGPGIPAGFGDELNKQVQTLYAGGTSTEAMSNLDTWWTANAGG